MKDLYVRPIHKQPQKPSECEGAHSYERTMLCLREMPAPISGRPVSLRASGIVTSISGVMRFWDRLATCKLQKAFWLVTYKKSL